MEKNLSSSPLYNIGVVTRLTGIAIATLHAWERRYGFPDAARTAGKHRLYSEMDIARLRWIKSQVEAGMAISRAVIAVRSLEANGRFFLPLEPETVSISISQRPIGERGPDKSASPSLRDLLFEALIHHDLSRADQLMGDMLAFTSPENLTLDVIGPTMNAIGEAWEQEQITVATEHLATNYLRHRLLMWMVTGSSPMPGSPIVLACAPGEWHEGSLLMIGVLLRRKGWPVAYLGQNVPFHDLAGYANEIHPRAVVLVAMCEKPAQELVGWPKWINQQAGRPIITFGGRAFVVQPELQGLVPGIYLGSTILEGSRNLDSILQQVKE
jgi:MerR family transcriptional regulator, light-induced transcriptional regulator